MRARLAALTPLVPLILAHPLALAAQEPEPDDRETTADTTPGHGLLNLGIHGTGISFGNSARWTGFRINFRDRGVQRIDGVNLTIWKAATNANRHAVINGLAAGIIGPEGGRLSGVTLVREGEMDGINVGGMGLVADGAIRGINIGGLGAVADGGMTGLNVGGLGVVANGGMRGITLGGLGAVSNGKMEGIAIGGLGTVADGGMTGIAIGGVGPGGAGGPPGAR